MRSKPTPNKVSSVAQTFIRSNRSRRKKTPNNRAKMMLVSLNAVTRAIGAMVKAQVTMP